MSNTILAVLAEAAGAIACLDAARAAAAAIMPARLVVLHVRADPETTIIPSEEILTPRQRQMLVLEAEAEAAGLRAVFTDWRAHQPRDVPAAWQGAGGNVAAEVARHGRAATLVVMAAPGPHARGHAQEAFRAALFATGRPLLRVPHAGPAHPPRRIAIGWKDTDVCRRAVTAAVPWLRRAGSVDVLHSIARGPDELEAAARLLEQLGVRATRHALAHGERPVGEQLLAEAASRHADWLVIGAYRRPPFAEWLLGGVTRVMLQQARLPVFMLY